MKKATQLVLCFLLLLGFAWAQEVPQPAAAPITAPTISYQPQYFLGAGAGFNQYATPQASGWLTFGVKVSDLNFTYTTLTMTSKSSSIGQGFGRYLIESNKFTLAALADIGVATGGGSIGGAFGVGGSLSYDISRVSKIPHTALVATIKCDKSSGADVKPTFLFGVVLGLGN